jgi:hypothetical protein
LCNTGVGDWSFYFCDKENQIVKPTASLLAPKLNGCVNFHGSDVLSQLNMTEDVNVSCCIVLRLFTCIVVKGTDCSAVWLEELVSLLLLLFI